MHTKDEALLVARTILGAAHRSGQSTIQFAGGFKALARDAGVGLEATKSAVRYLQCLWVRTSDGGEGNLIRAWEVRSGGFAVLNVEVMDHVLLVLTSNEVDSVAEQVVNTPAVESAR